MFLRVHMLKTLKQEKRAYVLGKYYKVRKEFGLQLVHDDYAELDPDYERNVPYLPEPEPEPDPVEDPIEDLSVLDIDSEIKRDIEEE